MKRMMILMTVFIVVLSAHANELKPLPDMSSAKVATAKDAEGIILNKIMADPNYGLSSTVSVVAKLSFTLGADFAPFGKKGDRVWQVHRVAFAQTTSITWINAENGSVHIVFPKEEKKPMSYAERLRRRREEMEKKKVEQSPGGDSQKDAPQE